MSFGTPEAAALAGDRISAETCVLACAVASNNAAVILTDPRWGYPERVWCLRSDDGWVEVDSASGGTSWSSLGGESDRGVLVSWGLAEPGASAVNVTFHGSTTKVPVTNGHWAWIVEAVPESERDDPADFDWVF